MNILLFSVKLLVTQATKEKMKKEFTLAAKIGCILDAIEAEGVRQVNVCRHFNVNVSVCQQTGEIV